MISVPMSRILRYLRRHATKDLEVGIKQRGKEVVLYRRSRKKGRRQDPDEQVLVFVFASPGPEHGRTPTRRERTEMKELVGGGRAGRVETVLRGPSPLVFTATRAEAEYFAGHLKAYRRQVAEAGGAS